METEKPKGNFWSDLESCYLIAEIGVNHNGSLELAKKMVRAAKDCGADAVKFQTFTAEALVSPGTPKVRYQENTTSPKETHFEMIKRLELNREDHLQIKAYCKDIEIEFLSTPYDLDSAKFLNDIGVRFFKSASADIVDLPLHKFIASTGKPSIIATGMATLTEVADVVEIYNDHQNRDVVLLHCVSNYPCSDSSLNLLAMNSLKEKFNTAIGYSDHSIGSTAAIASIALGAKVIEKHFTLDKDLPGPDHRASSTPCEFADLVREVRRAELMLGSKEKSCQPEERQMSTVSRKSLVLARSVSAGEVLREGDLKLMRPGTGIMAAEISRVVGRKVRSDLPLLHQVCWNDLEG